MVHFGAKPYSFILMGGERGERALKKVKISTKRRIKYVQKIDLWNGRWK